MFTRTYTPTLWQSLIGLWQSKCIYFVAFSFRFEASFRNKHNGGVEGERLERGIKFIALRFQLYAWFYAALPAGLQESPEKGCRGRKWGQPWKAPVVVGELASLHRDGGWIWWNSILNRSEWNVNSVWHARMLHHCAKQKYAPKWMTETFESMAFPRPPEWDVSSENGKKSCNVAVKLSI